MTHVPFITVSYALGVGVPLCFGIAAWQRLRQAARRLAAVDKRGAP